MSDDLRKFTADLGSLIVQRARDANEREESFQAHLDRIREDCFAEVEDARLRQRTRFVRLLESEMEQDRRAMATPLASPPSFPAAPPPPQHMPSAISPETMARRFVPNGAKH